MIDKLSIQYQMNAEKPDDVLADLEAAAELKLKSDLLYKADCFDYLCWLEEKEQRERQPGADFLCLASDGTTCWGKTYSEAVKVAMNHDKEIEDKTEAKVFA